MAQVEHVVQTIKRLLKANGITYAQVAEALALSEASVKRLFSEQDFSLERLDKICSLLGLDFLELMQEADVDRRKLTELTEEQEEDLVTDRRLLLIAHLAINGYCFQDMLQQYQFSEPELIRCLIKLQRIGLLELLPLNRIKMTISTKFSWRRGGPVQRFFLKNFLVDFFDAPFADNGSVMCIMSGVMSNQSLDLTVEKIKELEVFIADRTRIDAKLPVNERRNCGCVLAMRPWRSKLYDALRA